jgi:hypothetical protein
LQAYAANLPARPFVSVGKNPLTLYLVWDTVFAKRGWMEMLVLEPDGSLYSPVFGTLSPSGRFSADAQTTNTYYEGWASNQFVESGTYYYLAWLVSDSTNYQPAVDVQYRLGNAALTSLYGPGTYPRLSLQKSFRNDPNATFTKVFGGSYSDLKEVAYWIAGSSGAVVVKGEPSLSPSAGAAPMLTVQQMSALREFAAKAKLSGLNILNDSYEIRGAARVRPLKGLPGPLRIKRR